MQMKKEQVKRGRPPMKYEPEKCPFCGETFGATYLQRHMKLCRGKEHD
jgi:hypothetical protein